MLGTVLLSLVSGVIFRVLVALGIGYMTFTGIGQFQDYVDGMIKSAVSGLPGDVYGILAYMGFGTCINILLSAVAIRFTMNGFTNALGSITAWMIMKNSGNSTGGGD